MTLEALKTGDLTVNKRLIRHGYIRRYLAGEVVTSIDAIVEHLADEGVGVSKVMVEKDIALLGAVKVATPESRHGRWIIPAWNPLKPNIRGEADQQTIEQEVAIKIRAHVTDMMAHGSEVIVLTERNAGPLVADWISLLNWTEVLHVGEYHSSCVLRCTDPDTAYLVRARLLGES